MQMYFDSFDGGISNGFWAVSIMMRAIIRATSVSFMNPMGPLMILAGLVDGHCGFCITLCNQLLLKQVML